jgi:holo-[acyl-carrier protein] synthase
MSPYFESVGCRVGIDLMTVSQVREALQTHGDRYLHRIFTDHELACCRTTAGLSPESLAARWAAKEATIKVLQPVDHQPEWTRMEVRRQPNGASTLELTGTAADLAEAAGITSLSLSMTHEGHYAAAIVFALCDPPGRPRTSSKGPASERFLDVGGGRRKDRVGARAL